MKKYWFILTVLGFFLVSLFACNNGGNEPDGFDSTHKARVDSIPVKDTTVKN